MKKLFKLTNIAKSLICVFLFILTITPNNVFAVTNTKKVSAINGRVTVTFKYVVATTPKITDFVVTQAINKGKVKTVKPTKIIMDKTKKIATLTVPIIAKTSAIQNVIYKVSYKKDKIVSSPTMAVAKATFGNIKGCITWQYNNYVGTKPDTGARIALIPTNIDKNVDKSFFSLAIAQIPQGENGIYTGKADGYGNYEIQDVPVGKYYLLVISKNTRSDMEISEYSAGYLKPLFLDEDWEKLCLELKLNKYEFKTIEIKADKTIIESYDFGNTYF